MNRNEESSILILAWILAIVALCFIFLVAPAHGQSNNCNNGDALVVNTGGNKNNQCIPLNQQPAGTSTAMVVANDTVTGTTVNRLAKLSGAPSKAIITATTDTENAVGVVTAGAGTAGNATIAIIGQVTCDFDNATVAGDYVTISAITAGKCHDAGASWPQTGATYGRVLSTNGASGSFVMELMTPDVAFQNAGNGKSKPGTPVNSVQVNSPLNTFGGFSQFTYDNTTQRLLIGGSGAVNGNLRIQDNTARSFDFGWNGSAQVITANGLELDMAGGDVYVYTGGGPSQRWRFDLNGNFTPSGSNGGFNIGDGGHNVGTLSMFKQIVFTNVNDATASEPFINHARTWNSGGVTFQNIVSNITDSASAAASTLIDLQVGGASKMKVDKAGVHTSVAYATATNCADSAGAAACGSAAAGAVVIDAGSTSVVVSTTAVTANSEVFVQYDSSLGTRLGITCNTTPALPAVTARTAGTSFTITVPAAPAVNPACYTYHIIN